MRAAVVTGLLLAVRGLAQDYPKPNGFVNDFANQLPLDAVQSLEMKVRDYQRATGNQIGVAVVPSLNGTSIDEYSLGLFRAWGVGQYGVNNGVLFVWAPKERKIHIEVGRGLGGVLNQAERERILAQVRTLFRELKYEEGVNAAVDGVIGVLGPGSSGSAAPQPIPKPEPGFGTLGVALLVAAGLGVGVWLIVRRSRAARWTEELPRQLAEAGGAITEAEHRRADAQVAMMELRREASDDVCGRFEVILSEAPGSIERLKRDLNELRMLPQASYSELRMAHRKMSRLQERTRAAFTNFSEVRDTLDAFMVRRSDAERMLKELPSKLTRMEAEGVPGSAEGLLRAAAATYGQALQESLRQPANWLLVYDLLADVGECLERIENPSRARYQPVRYWTGDFNSPAGTALEMMYVAQSQDGGISASSSGGFDSGGGGGGGFDTSGGFGGGDSGGGGSSSGY
jgi:uncharacterized membrane protein YgcG